MWLLAAIGCGGGDGTPLGVTMHDGQVVVGDVTTEHLVLEGVFGTVDVPLADVGVVVPVEAATLGASKGQVTVWLRNGSELRGKWVDPELALGVWAGGVAVPVEVPVDSVEAIQLRGGEEWPAPGTVRIRTSHGDDVLVDPASTSITLKNELGAFSPRLSECASVGPVGDPTGDWRVVLNTGTVLVGKVQQDSLDLHLPSGPDSVKLALADLVSIDRSVWTEDASRGSGYAQGNVVDGLFPASAVAPPQSSGKLGRSEGWFSNERMSGAKR